MIHCTQCALSQGWAPGSLQGDSLPALGRERAFSPSLAGIKLQDVKLGLQSCSVRTASQKSEEMKLTSRELGRESSVRGREARPRGTAAFLRTCESYLSPVPLTALSSPPFFKIPVHLEVVASDLRKPAPPRAATHSAPVTP